MPTKACHRALMSANKMVTAWGWGGGALKDNGRDGLLVRRLHCRGRRRRAQALGTMAAAASGLRV